MNASGAALASLRGDPAFDPARDLLILVDDFAIPTGTFRLRSEGSAGGHNGLKSIEAALQSQLYPRLRIGVGPLDRKSTRLNSSHGYISYAVFCLKKKTNK